MLDLYWTLARPLLFKLDVETAHNRVIGALGRTPRAARRTLSALAGPPADGLALSLGPLRLGGPIGLAAGLDKDGEAVEVWPALGFGFVEIGTVTAHPQPGNPKPRCFRLVDEGALINRMGFNNAGSEALAGRLLDLKERGRWPAVPVAPAAAARRMAQAHRGPR